MFKPFILPAATVVLLLGAHGAAASPPHPNARCDPVPVKTTHGTRANTTRVTRCTFTPSSGRWIESTSGDEIFAAKRTAVAN